MKRRDKSTVLEIVRVFSHHRTSRVGELGIAEVQADHGAGRQQRDGDFDLEDGARSGRETVGVKAATEGMRSMLNTAMTCGACAANCGKGPDAY